MLAVITVNYRFDEDDGIDDQQVSLRDAINEAVSGDQIEFDFSQLNGETIDLLPSLGQIEIIGKSLTIDASNLSNGLTIFGIDPDRNDPFPIPGNGRRIFKITDPTFGSDPPLVTLKGSATGKLTLTGGDAEALVTDDFGEGGAIRSEARLALNHCKIVSNQASGGGGGIFLSVAGSGTTPRDILTVVDTIIHDNSSSSGGGGVHIVSANGSAVLDQVVFTRTEITQNQAVGSGGGVFASISGTNLLFESTLFEGNTSADIGGGLAFLASRSTVTLEKSAISGNEAGSSGGGLYGRANQDDSAPSVLHRVLTISESIVDGNKAGTIGGGLHTKNFSNTETLVIDSQITGNNEAIEAGGKGGGMYVYQSGGVGHARPRFTITRSTVDGNKAGVEGGGVFVCVKHFGDFVATNATISGNWTLDEVQGQGGGMMVATFPDGGASSVDAYLRNVTITQNESAMGGGVRAIDMNNVRVRVANSIVSENFNHQTAPNNKSNMVGRFVIADVRHNLIGNGSAILEHVNGVAVPLNMLPAGNIISDAPMLSAELGDHGGPTPTHRLESGSPAIDAGSILLDNDPLTGVDLATDQRGPGFPRVFDFPSVPGSAAGPVDIGAYELGPGKVIDVIISGFVSAHDDYHFRTATFDGDPVIGNGNQLRTVPVGGADTVKIHFDNDVANLVSGSLTLTRLTSGAAQTLASGGFSYNPVTHVATWKFAAPLAADQYLINLADTITAAGLALDGEWKNPFTLTTTNPAVSEFPSGNGTAGGAFRFVFTNLPGDATLDNWVTFPDFLIWQQNLGGTGDTFNLGDFNGDGVTDGADLSIYQANSNRHLVDLVFADFDQNGTVNSLDLGIASSHYGMTGATHADGDANDDGQVDGADMIIVWRQLGLFFDWIA